MADFKTALEALAKGTISQDVLNKQLSGLLQKTPQYATRMLAQLDEVHNQGKIDDPTYADLKRQINQYRRAHATQTEGGGEAGGDSTVFDQEGSRDSTRVMEDEEKPATDTGAFNVTGGDMSGVDIDISALDSSDISGPSITSGTGPAGTAWSEPSTQHYQPGQEMGPGSVIKQRFKLLEVLGVGGMGKVYKGIDLLKEEARDKNPYVAIKLLNEDFREHPEAFISLQRESSRQQKLAHPNIATVYDFDRIGGPGTPVYITMELMEGQPLNDYIKKTVRKQGGIPFDEAFTIIRQLGAALSYAHERRLVHSDFKPGNAFLCNDGAVKTLDFGIARAVKNPVTGEAEKTLFDPGKLGALTPAYASLEMLEGEEPDTRDDTYALGCVAYELLTGKHPFNKLPANKALENNLLPANVKGLKAKQNKALRKAVAFRRKDRYETVDEFIEDLEARFIWYKNPYAVAAILVVVIGIGATAPVLNYFHQQEVQQITADIKTGDPQVIEDRLALIAQYEKADQLTITDEAKDAIQNHFKLQIGRLIDTSKENYNFPRAKLILAKIGDYYPDSSFWTEQKELIDTNQKQKLGQLYSEFTDALTLSREQGDTASLDNTKAILNTIRLKVDPENPLLTDPQPSNQYRVLAANAFSLGNFDEATQLVSSGLEIAPGNQQLTDLKNKIERTIKIASLEGKLGNIRSQLNTLAAYKQHEADIVELAKLDAGNTLLASLATGFQQNINQEVSTLLSSGTRDDAVALANEYNALMSSLQLGRELTQIKLAHLTGADRSKAIQEIASNNKKAIEGQMAKPQPESDEWKSSLLANVQELDSLASEDPTIASELGTIRSSIAELYISNAEETLKSDRFDVADSLLDTAERFAPGLFEIQSARTAVAEAKAAYEKKILVDGLKDNLVAQTESNDVNKAKEILDQLKAELPADDPYMTTEGPGLLSKSYERLAKNRFDAKDYVNARILADQGLAYNPNNNTLVNSRKEYVVEANIVELMGTFKTGLTFDTASAQSKIGEIANSPRFSAFRQDAIALLSERINELKTTDQNSAATLAQSAAIIFPGTVLEEMQKEIQLQPWPNNAAARASLAAGKLTEATNIQQAAAAEFTGHPEFVTFSENLAKQKADALASFEQYQAAKNASGNDKDKLREEAKPLLDRALAFWTDNPDYRNAKRELDSLITVQIIRREEEGTITAMTEEPGKVEEAWKPISSGRECIPDYAGYGKRSKAVCYDMVHAKARGPLMVVIPSGGEFQNNFAIGRYEISIGDYSKYCALTGKCKPETNTELFDEPQTGISLQNAEGYVQWLSERTGKTYRLPTPAEWEYAASAGGSQPKKDFNCRVALGDKIIKGTGTVSVKSGQSNGWGLKNYIGNVQEWVLDGGNAKARGGAYEDQHSKCDIGLERSHNGSPDKTTGFRVILEDVS